MGRDVETKKLEYFNTVEDDEDEGENMNGQNSMGDENDDDEEEMLPADVIMYDEDDDKDKRDEGHKGDSGGNDDEDDEVDDEDDEEVLESVNVVPVDRHENNIHKEGFSPRYNYKMTRRQTIDTTNLRQLVLRNNTNNEIRSKLTQTLNLNKNQIIIDYNILAFMENREVESDTVMEARMAKFISSFKKNYKGIQHIEYKINNKLFCAIDIIYFLPILFNKSENRDLAQLNRKSIDAILDRLDLLSEKLLPNSTKMSATASAKRSNMPSTIPEIFSNHATTSDATMSKSSKKPVQKSGTSAPTLPTTSSNSSESPGDRNIRLYQIGSDYYLMCRKKQNFVDGQKNLEKKYGKCRLLKVWNNRNDVKHIGKLILLKFPHMKWNARTNILSNSKNKQVSENDLLNYLIKVIK